MAININGINISSTGTSLSVANGATTWLGVSSGGVVTRPQTPYMRAVLSGQGSFYRALTVTFGSVISNVGSCWNNSTGIWTCPVAGYYLVTMGGLASGSGQGVTGYGYFYIFKNGSIAHFSHWNNATSWDYCSLSAVLSCAANDTINFRIISGPADNSGSGGWYGGGDHGQFGIALVT